MIIETIQQFIELILNLDKYIGALIQTFGLGTYAILFFIVFLETGFVVTPFLPGDSLLFASGAFAAQGLLDITILFLLLSAAAILGDSVNYSIGKYLGPKMFKENSRYLKKKYLERTEKFYEKHGCKTIVIARFVPVVRTFAPFVAGIGKMTYKKFLSYNIIGGISWVAIFLFGGYFFGSIPLVKENFSIVIIGIIVVSLLPVVIELIRHNIKK